MREYTSLIYEWIKPLRKVKEFQEIAKTEDIEFKRLYGMAERALLNMFIEWADEFGITRLEKITGIYPDKNDTLEARRARLYLYWNEKEPYTEEELKNRLITICGENGFDINTDYPHYAIEIITRLGGYGVFDEVTSMLDYFLPANLELTLENRLTEESSSGIYFGNPTQTAMVYTITNDIDVTYPVTSNLYTGSPVSTAMVDTITNDIDEEISSTSNQYISNIINPAFITEIN